MTVWTAGADLTIAVDVGRPPIPGRMDVPKALESFLGAFEIMQAAASARKIESRAPDIIVRPQVWEIGILDFTKVDQVLEQAKPAMVELRNQLSGSRAAIAGLRWWRRFDHPEMSRADH